MSNVVELPNSHSVWAIIRSGYRDFMQAQGLPAETIAVILDEFKIYHDRLHSDQHIAFKWRPQTQYTEAQLQEITAAAEQLSNDFGAYLQDRLGAAHGMILHMLVEKYAGGWPDQR